MTTHRSVRVLPVLVGLLLAWPALGYADPGGPLIGFGQRILDFITGPMAYVIVALGIAIAGISLVVGSREGIQRAIYAIVGGGLLFGVHAVVEFIQSAAR